MSANDICWRLVAPVTGNKNPKGEALLVEVLREAESYRRLTQEAIHALHGLTVKHQQLVANHRWLSREHRRLDDQYRHLRARTIWTAAA